MSVGFIQRQGPNKQTTAIRNSYWDLRTHNPRTTDHESGGLGLLTNQLYRPTCKSITPTLGFGFAVDGGGCFAESQALVIFWSIPKKCYTRQAGDTFAGRPVKLISEKP
ncbi:MAG: hypothetical protein P8I97_10090 [Verrucomicrobiales bacterium]|nr:hypothetical protein [Verrucomicrobiales bacterium]